MKVLKEMRGVCSATGPGLLMLCEQIRPMLQCENGHQIGATWYISTHELHQSDVMINGKSIAARWKVADLILSSVSYNGRR